MCDHIIKRTAHHGFPPEKIKCDKKIYKDGFCWQHYKRKILKQTPWGERKDYRSATWEDFYDGISLKLKEDSSNNLYRYNGGFIQKHDKKTGKYMYITTPANIEKFCVKL